jgi:inosine-uridine nucleoside N-ribohydrolase
MNSDEPVTLICVGPVQNIGEALRREPRIVEKARFVGMHGHVAENAGPEYNVKMDPKSLQQVFTAPWEVTITPFNTCAKVVLTGDRYQRVYTSDDPIAEAIMLNYRMWANHRGLDSKEAKAVPSRSSILFDTVAVYLAFSQEWCGMERLGIRITDEGVTLEDPDAKKVNVAMTWKDQDAFEDFLVERITGGSPASLP